MPRRRSVELQGVLQDARGTLKGRRRAGRGPGGRRECAVATEDLGALRGEVDASLRKVNRLVDQINRKWPFAGKNEEIKLP
jgi:phospholipid/cholesterol/gamma-HCH transport system substrate-binding protein